MSPSKFTTVLQNNNTGERAGGSVGSEGTEWPPGKHSRKT